MPIQVEHYYIDEEKKMVLYGRWLYISLKDHNKLIEAVDVLTIKDIVFEMVANVPNDAQSLIFHLVQKTTMAPTNWSLLNVNVKLSESYGKKNKNLLALKICD